MARPYELGIGAAVSNLAKTALEHSRELDFAPTTIPSTSLPAVSAGMEAAQSAAKASPPPLALPPPSLRPPPGLLLLLGEQHLEVAHLAKQLVPECLALSRDDEAASC